MNIDFVYLCWILQFKIQLNTQKLRHVIDLYIMVLNKNGILYIAFFDFLLNLNYG